MELFSRWFLNMNTFGVFFNSDGLEEGVVERNNFIIIGLHLQYIIFNLDSFKCFVKNVKRMFRVRILVIGTVIGWWDELNHDVDGFIIINGIKRKQLSGFSQDDLSRRCHTSEPWKRTAETSGGG